jgi:hypothetical protein
VTLHDNAEGSGFLQNVVVWLPCDIASHPRRMESSATPLKNMKTLTLLLCNWSETGQLPEHPGSVIFFSPLHIWNICLILLILSSIIAIVLGFLDGFRCSGKILYASGARCHLVTSDPGYFATRDSGL